jgi:hypothetical protein
MFEAEKVGGRWWISTRGQGGLDDGGRVALPQAVISGGEALSRAGATNDLHMSPEPKGAMNACCARRLICVIKSRAAWIVGDAMFPGSRFGRCAVQCKCNQYPRTKLFYLNQENFASLGTFTKVHTPFLTPSMQHHRFSRCTSSVSVLFKPY